MHSLNPIQNDDYLMTPMLLLEVLVLVGPARFKGYESITNC